MQGEPACACIDCPLSCPPVDPPMKHNTETFLNSDSMYLLMGSVCAAGVVLIIIAGGIVWIVEGKSRSANISTG